CIQIQQTNKARPLAAPVCNCEDRTSVSVQSGENVMAILPDGFYNDQGRFRGNLAKDLHAVLLAVDESVALHWIPGMCPPHFPALPSDGIDHSLFDARLRGPAVLIRGEAQISIRNQEYRFGHILQYCGTGSRLRPRLRQIAGWERHGRGEQ